MAIIDSGSEIELNILCIINDFTTKYHGMDIHPYYK